MIGGKLNGPYTGSRDSSQEEIFTVGRNIVSTNGVAVIHFVDPDAVIRSVLPLDVGRHVVLIPQDVLVRVECADDVEWSVSWPARFNPFDLTRVEVSLAKPLSEFDQMKQYLNELAARTLGGNVARALRSGDAEFEFEHDDYSEEHEDDAYAPLSTHQLSIMIAAMQQDLAAAQAASSPAKPSSSVDETPVVDPPPGDEGKAVNETDS